ncbi:MAG TPA: NAD(P)/FAD-dependent oxidoreductase [Spirochaetia bacterium]|nr:NAD(P)/FAD-dependent oxidoreductase [Spirochaetia bacterium]
MGEYNVVVVGGGPAGMAAAIEARKADNARVLIIERNTALGGILPQCIHNGFGSVIFGADLPGPEYALRYIDQAEKLGVDVMLDTIVTEITPNREIYAMNSRDGYMHMRPDSIVLAMGCRERTRSQIQLPGVRCTGIFTAGTVQRLVNIEGYMPGKRVVVLGSGDIGMIMARRLTIEGAQVVGVFELLPFLTGLRRNYVQCLLDYNIPLHLSTTVTNIFGDRRLEAVEVSRVDEKLQPITGTAQRIECDTLLLSVGLIPENELSRSAGVELDSRTAGPFVDNFMATNVPGIFAAGNVVMIYDLVDYVSKAGVVAGGSAVRYAKSGEWRSGNYISLSAGDNVGVLQPQKMRIDGEDQEILLKLRSSSLFERRVTVEVRDENGPVVSFKEKYARPAEMIIHPLKPKEIQAIKNAGSQRLTVVIQ